MRITDKIRIVVETGVTVTEPDARTASAGIASGRTRDAQLDQGMYSIHF